MNQEEDNIYNCKFKPSELIKQVLDKFELNKQVKTCGKIIAIRNDGLFFNISYEHTQIQCMANIEKRKSIKMGDYVGVEGVCFLTNSKEKTIKVSKIYIISKCLNFIPKSYYSVKNEETLRKERVLHMLSDENAYNMIKFRSESIRKIREYLSKLNYMEVETPILHQIPGGAEADPFKTYHNSTKKELYLRIAPEIYLKRMVAAGFNKIFEIGKVFRNEGMSTKHNPEFTMLEIYTSFEDLNYIIKLAENIYSTISSKQIQWETISFEQAVINVVGQCDVNDLQSIRDACKGKLCFDENESCYDIAERIIDKYLEKHDYVHIINHPKAISPLAKSHPDNPNIAMRFESFIKTMEIANGYEELIDPIEQENNFKKQFEINKRPIDFQYIHDMKYGMPNIAGLGIGIDRLIMASLNANMKDVMLFKQT